MSYELFLSMNEYGAAGMYKEPNRSLFYRKSLGIRMYYENCELYEYYNGILFSHEKERNPAHCDNLDEM